MVVTKSVSTQLIQLLVAMALALLVVLLFRGDVRGDMNAGEILIRNAASRRWPDPF